MIGEIFEVFRRNEGDGGTEGLQAGEGDFGLRIREQLLKHRVKGTFTGFLAVGFKKLAEILAERYTDFPVSVLGTLNDHAQNVGFDVIFGREVHQFVQALVADHTYSVLILV